MSRTLSSVSSTSSSRRSTAEEDDFNHGFILPTLVAQLKKMLDQFPDDLQILKEMVQNAEDAGAHEVNFMLDLNSYGRDQRFFEHPELANHQGPALYSHNDALFTEDDWRGVRMLSESVKRDDPFRIGCFGVGFKSVFHLTDLPCMLSGDRLAIIDPHQQLFEAACHCLDLSATPDLFTTFPHQVEPYLGIFGCDKGTFTSGAFYDGTIFRLPLRCRQSRLSSKMCSTDKVDIIVGNEKIYELFDSFEKEAHLMLIFTSNITRLSLYERSKVQRLLFRAELSPSCVEEVQRKRAEFKNNVKTYGHEKEVSATFELVILTEKYNERSQVPVKMAYRYLVMHLQKSSSPKSSQIFVNILNDREVNSLPWIATAMSLDHTLSSVVNGDADEHSRVNEMQLKQSADDGRLFCFLPLPVERNSPSGLPFHVHATFALEQYKKQIKWPPVSRFTDFSAERSQLWNQCLLKEVLPSCFARMISEAVSISSLDDLKVSVKSIYRAFPDLSRLDRKWDTIVSLLYLELQNQPAILHCPSTDVWSDIKSCLFIGGNADMTIDIVNAITDVMTAGKVKVAECPDHVLQALKKFGKPAMVTPRIVADVMRDVQGNCSFPWEDKMSLLRYFLRHSKPDLLDGLQLLPLANGGFATFKVGNKLDSVSPVYVAPDDETRLVLPGLSDDMLEFDIDDWVRKALMTIASKGLTQLKMLDATTVCKLLPTCLPLEWLSENNSAVKYPVAWNTEAKGHPQESWLKALWAFLARNLPRDLSCMDHIPIVPLQSYQTTIINNDETITSFITEMIPLVPNQVIIARNSSIHSLSPDLEDALTRLGIWVIEELPIWIKKHPLVFKGTTVFEPTPASILKALEKKCAIIGGKVKFANMFSVALSYRLKKSISSALAQLQSFEVQKDGLALIYSLPLFECLGSSSAPIRLNPDTDDIELIAASEAKTFFSSEMPSLPFPISQKVLECNSASSHALAKLLGIKPTSVIQLLIHMVLPDAEKGDFYDRKGVISVALYCLENYQSLVIADKGFKKALKNLSFLPRGDVLLPPGRFYDPLDEELQKLFIFEDNFPPASFSESSKLLAALKDLGLRNASEVDATDLKECALVLQQLSLVPDVTEILPSLTAKSSALLEYLQNHRGKISEKCGAIRLAEALKDVRFVKALESADDVGSQCRYPKSLKWFGTLEKGLNPDEQKIFCCPSQMALKCHALAVGSVLPLVAFDVTSIELAKGFGWDGPPPVVQVVKHLCNVIESYDPNEQEAYTDVVVSIYSAMVLHRNEDELLHLIANHLPLEWAWYGDGFVRPQDLLLNPLPSFQDLRPYAYLLPDELAPFQAFFSRFGASHNPDVVRVLEVIRAKYERGSGFRTSDVRRDLQLCVALLEELAFPEGRHDSDSKTESAGDDDEDYKRSNFEKNEESSFGDEKGDSLVNAVSSSLFFLQSSRSGPPVEVHLPIYEPDNSASSNRIRFEMADHCAYLEGGDLNVGRARIGKGIDFCNHIAPVLRQLQRLPIPGYEDYREKLRLKNLQLVHPFVPVEVSRALGVPSLLEATMTDFSEETTLSPTGHIVSSIGSDGSFRSQQTMQSSTQFTELIKPLVKPFAAREFSLPLEMIQNADDAGATEIRFLLDERQNLDAKNGLLDDGMGNWQGPALWVYNDAVMTDDDFADAFTLDTTTKQSRTDRIGRNGRGLCAVYSITDVPSFVSRNWVVFFDPHLRYLGRSLKERSKFGLRINLNRYRRQLSALSGQFKPYEGIFGWSLRNADIHYPATLFRLPLRNKQLASRSDICKRSCEVEDIKEMFRHVYKNAESLLLFTQNLVKVSLFHVNEKGSLINDFVELMSFSKRPLKILRELKPDISQSPTAQGSRFLDSEAQKLVQQSSLLWSSTEVMRKIRSGYSSAGGGSSLINLERLAPNSPDASVIIAVEIKVSSNAERWLRLRKEQSLKPWLVTNCMGKGDILSISLKQPDLIPCGSAAVPLEFVSESNSYRPLPLYNSQNEPGGIIFNFMPTASKSGLPLHINGSFLLADDHQSFVRESKNAAYSVWNEKLMATAISQAFIRLICDLAALSQPDAYPFHLLWPDPTQTSSDCLALVRTFYKEMSRISKYICITSPAVFSDGNRWSPLDSTYFFDCNYTDASLLEASIQVSRQVMAASQSGMAMVRLPSRVFCGFDQAGAAKTVALRTYNKVQFFEKVFLPHIDSVAEPIRDLLVIEALRQVGEDSQLANVLRIWQCVPVGATGNRLEKPFKLVDPRSTLSFLYTKNENCMPHGQYATDLQILDALCLLGMKSKASDISWEEIVEKCRSLHLTKDQQLVRDISQAIISVIDEKLLHESDRSFSTLRHFQQVLTDLPFLVAKPRPAKFVLPMWAGSSESVLRGGSQKTQLYRAVSLLPPDCLDLVCCVEPVLDNSLLLPDASSVLDFLKIGAGWKEPTIGQVVDQLDVLTNPDHESKLNDSSFRQEIEKYCISCYGFLQKKCSGSPEQQRAVYDALKGRYFVLCQNRFLLPKQLAFNFPQNGSPYLYQLPEYYGREFPDLFRVTEVKEQFSVQDYVEALQSLHDARPREKLDRESYVVAATLVGLLRGSMTQTGIRTCDVISRYGPIYLPDSLNVLRSTSELKIDDITSTSSSSSSRTLTLSSATREIQNKQTQPVTSYQHSQPPQQQPELVQHQSQLRFSSSYSPQPSSRLSDPMIRISKSFGAPRGNEPLLTRLRRVVCGGRSNDRDILKELLRNADDAGSTEVSFVKDLRTHRARDDFWKYHQGPALCIHLNKPLSKVHLEEILSSGHCRRAFGSSKSGDPSKTGLYGVGFDSVFRLTDVPSILTTVKNSESLYVIDPQARFVGGTTVEEPIRHFEDLNSIRNSNPGLMVSFLKEKFNLQDGTMIRLPLRSVEAAALSELSDDPISPKTLDIMFDKFRQEVFDCLLFLENVTSVSLFEIETNTDVLKEVYKISVDTKEYNVEGKIEFHENVEKALLIFKAQPTRLIDLPSYEMTYPLTISDNHGHWEKWVVSHRFGLDSGAKVSQSVSEMVQSGRLVLLPFGSVAAMLDSSDAESHNRSSKAFSRLPLTVKTELPAHVNANFCLDDETGRNLWPEDEPGYKAEWNNLLLRSVVAPAYVAVLSQTPPMLGTVRSGSGSFVYLATLDSFGDEIQELDIYSRFFPKLTRQMSHGSWRNLIESVYQIIDSKQVAVIPVAIASVCDQTSSASTSSLSITSGTTEVEWYSTRVVGYQKPFFDNLKDSYRELEEQTKVSSSSSVSIPSPFAASVTSSSQSRRRRSRSHFKRQPHEILRWSLLACGFKLSRLPVTVFESFVAAGVAVACVTPKAVIDFFKSYFKSLSTPVVTLPQLPCDLSQTPFKDEATLKMLLEYCSQDIPYFRSNLNGLPLLLCEDGLLRQFSNSRDRRVFLSTAHCLLPGSEASFVHHSLVGSVFKEADVESCDVFWRFDVRSFSSELPTVLDRNYAVETAVRRDITNRGCPKDLWLKDVWSFLADEFQRTAELNVSYQQQQRDEESLALNLLKPLSNWCLLPVLLRQKPIEKSSGAPTKSSDHLNNTNSYTDEDTTAFLIPVNLVHAVLDYSANSISGNQIRRCFGRLGIFELDVNFFEETIGTTLLSPSGSSKRAHQVASKISGNSMSSKIISFLRLIVSNPENPKSVLTSVEFVLSRPEGPENVGLNLDESFTILKYFSDSLNAWRNDPTAKSRLFSMPLHLSADGRLVPIDSECTYILQDHLPYTGMDLWQKKTKIVFLKPCPAFESLYVALGFKLLSPASAYLDHLFKFFDCLPTISREDHLAFIKNSIVPLLKNSEKTHFLTILSKTKLLPDSKEERLLKRPMDLYDPRVPIFQAMARTNSSVEFPGPPFNTPEWLDFFSKYARLESEPSGDLLVTFAKQIASDSKRRDYDGYDILVTQCQALMKHLFTAKVVSEPLKLEKLVDVAFIPPAKALPSHQKMIHSSQGRDLYANPVSWVCIKDCVSYKYHDICWSSSHLLPYWADPLELPNIGDSRVNIDGSCYPVVDSAEENETVRREIAERLCYSDQPTIDAVVEHVQNVCTLHHHHHQSSSSSAAATAATRSTSMSTSCLDEPVEVKNLKASILHKVYAFLNEKIEEATNQQALADIQKSLHRLSAVPCVAVDGGMKFVSPKQVAINLYDDDQVTPYLCQAPAELGQFKQLLLNLGATMVATPEQYANALESISLQAGGEKLHPNEMRLAFTAVRGFFESLRRLRYRDEDPLTRVHWLYLPTRSGHMHRSTEMLFNDDEPPAIVDRLQRAPLARPLLVDLSECRLSPDDHVDMVSLLPTRLRPILLSRAVREHLEPKCRESLIYHAVADKLKYQVSSRLFAQGLIRLVRHERGRRRFHYRAPVRQTVLESIEHTLKRVRVHGIDHLVTYLTLEGRRLKNSEMELECFAEKSSEDEEDVVGSEIWNIYVNRAACLSEELQTSLAEVVNRIVGGLLKHSIHYIQPIISCLPHNINKVLDKLNIKPDVPQHLQSPDPSCQPTLPAPGSLVPKEDHHLLKEEFEEFDIGEYIGYELEDDENAADGCPTYIYAVVLEKIVHQDFEASRPGSTTPSAAPYERRRGGAGSQHPSPQRRGTSGGLNLSTSSDPDHRKFTQEYRINVGDDRPPTIAPATDLYKFHRVEGRRRWNNDDPGSASKVHSPGGRQQVPTTLVDDGAFAADDSFSKRSQSKEEQNGHKRPTSTTPGDNRFNRHRADRSPRNIFTENNLFADEPSSPTGGDYIHQTEEFEGSWNSQQQQPTSTDVCQYDEEWGPRKASQQQKPSRFGRQDQTDSSANNPQRRADFEPQNEDDVITTERVMEEVSDALEEAWQLPENQRRKVVKRLLLRWHPDKNIGNEEFATIITQHVQAELERLELGLPRPARFDPSQFDFDPRNPFSSSSSFQQNFANAYKFFFDQMNQRAKEHKQQRERSRENFGHDYSGDPHSAYGANPQPAQAKRFLRQAQEDLRASDNDYDTADPSYEWVCFKAHQAAEKALKAAQFAVDAVTSFSHDLVTLAASLEDMELRRLAQKLQKIIGNSNRLYNPDPIDFQVIPHEDFTREMACDSVMCAVDILERVKEFVELRDFS